MRWIVIGALAIAALATALLFEVNSHVEPAPATVVHATEPALPAGSAVVAPAPPVEMHARVTPPTHSAPAAPTLAPAAPAAPDGEKPKHVDTPIDIMRWSLMRAIRNSEPAVIECLDHAKAAGTVIDGTAIFAFSVTTKNAKAVISRAGVESSPFPDDVNACIQATLATGELDQQLPEGQNEFRVLRELAVEKGTITRYKLKSYLAP
jgi:hypothetical protein